MDNKKVTKLLSKIKDNYVVHAPVKEGRVLKIREIDKIDEIDFSGAMPFNSWKAVFMPPREELFSFDKKGIKEVSNEKDIPMACVGVNVLDLKAITLWEQVFTNDCYYQRKKRNSLIVGYQSNFPSEYKKYKTFSYNYKEDVLEHLVFDIFITKLKNGHFKVYSGSEKGQRILNEYNIGDYEHIEFAGPISEKGPDKRMLRLAKKIDKSFNKKIWKELNDICIACGKCSLICPTCFCFNLEDSSDPNKNSRDRKWTSCFYNDFSKVAGGHKPLDEVKKKIYFWYVHKFVRIPREYNLPGCVSCGRCSKVCPVGIKIEEVLKKI